VEGPPTRRFPSPLTSHAEQEREIEEVRNVSFPTVMRGYDRDAVDDYIERVNRLIAELEISRSPESAVRHAVAQVSEETRGILERAHETAEEITARSRSRADDRLQEAEREAEAVRQAAEARVRELDADAEAIWNERVRLIEDVRDVAQRLVAVADDAAARFPSVHPEDETQALPAGAPLEQAEVFDAEAVETVAAPDEPGGEAATDAPAEAAPESATEESAADEETPAG
jgi:DivIVA domain-containing protein